jgi:hypothetical protein
MPSVMRSLLMNLFKTIAVVVVVLISNVATPAKDWRGITPRHSTRRDVEQLLGPARHNLLSGSIYIVDQSPVQVVYTGQGDPAEMCSRQVPLGTVLSIFVMPKDEVSPIGLGIDNDHFKSFKLFFGNLDYRGFYDERSGFLVHSLNGRVHDLSYFANAADRRRCRNYYRNAKHFGEMRYDSAL